MKILLIIAGLFLLSCIRTHDPCDWNIYDRYTDVGFFEHGSFGSTDTKWSVAIIADPKDWDHNIWFTGEGWENDKSKIFYASDTCELKNKICWAFGWDNYYKR
jgi:hypothetical protein